MSAARGLCCAEPAWEECRLFAIALFAMSIMPFSTTLLAQSMAYRVALLTYWLNMVLAGGSLYCSWNCAKGLGLVEDDRAPEVPRTIQCRILIGQALYAFGRCFALSVPTGASYLSCSCNSTAPLPREFGAARCNFRSVSLVTCVTARKQIPFTLEWRKGTMSVRILNIISNRKEG